MTSTSLPGADTNTLRAPALRCIAAWSRVRNRPVDSMTTSTSYADQSSRAGSASAMTATRRPSTTIAPSSASTSASSLPNVESCASRCASVAVPARSFTATTSTSRSCAIRKKQRPTRPNPLIPTRTVMTASWFSSRSALANLHLQCVGVIPRHGRAVGPLTSSHCAFGWRTYLPAGDSARVLDAAGAVWFTAAGPRRSTPLARRRLESTQWLVVSLETANWCGRGDRGCGHKEEVVRRTVTVEWVEFGLDGLLARRRDSAGFGFRVDLDTARLQDLCRGLLDGRDHHGAGTRPTHELGPMALAVVGLGVTKNRRRGYPHSQA